MKSTQIEKREKRERKRKRNGGIEGIAQTQCTVSSMQNPSTNIIMRGSRFLIVLLISRVVFTNQ